MLRRYVGLFYHPSNYNLTIDTWANVISFFTGGCPALDVLITQNSNWFFDHAGVDFKEDKTCNVRIVTLCPNSQTLLVADTSACTQGGLMA